MVPAAAGHRRQVAALPMRATAHGTLQILLITSRETGRWVIPKGWPIKGLKDHEAAAREALEEAGVVGRVRKAPLGSYTYWKRQSDHFELCEVTVYPLTVDRQLKTWREQGQRRAAWFPILDAARHVNEPGLMVIIEALGPNWP